MNPKGKCTKSFMMTDALRDLSPSEIKVEIGHFFVDLAAQVDNLVLDRLKQKYPKATLFVEDI